MSVPDIAYRPRRTIAGMLPHAFFRVSPSSTPPCGNAIRYVSTGQCTRKTSDPVSVPEITYASTLHTLWTSPSARVGAYL
eukprot:3886300-Rhodomonas_salina.2